MLYHVTAWLLPFVIFILFEVHFIIPKFILWTAFVSGLAVFIIIWFLSKLSLKFEFIRFLIIPMTYVMGALLFISIVEGAILRQVVLITLIFLLGVYLENVYLYWHKREKYQEYSLLNISSYFQLITIFMITASLYWMKLFLGISPWIALIIIFFITGVIAYQSLIIDSFHVFGKWRYMFVFSLLMTEFYWFTSFFPTSVYLNAALVTIYFYNISGVIRNHVMKNLTKNVIVRYSVISLVCIVFILLTAKYEI